MSVCVYSRVFSVTVTAGPSVPSSSWAYTLILYCVLAFRLLKQCLLAPPPSFVSCFWPSAGTNIDSLPFEKGRRVCPGSVCSVGKCFIWTCSVREEIKKWKRDTTKHSLLFYKNIIIVLQADCFFYTFGNAKVCTSSHHSARHRPQTEIVESWWHRQTAECLRTCHMWFRTTMNLLLTRQILTRVSHLIRFCFFQTWDVSNVPGGLFARFVSE